MAKAVYPGSFDPITSGHLDIIRRLNRVFDEVIVLVANAPDKSYLFNEKERCALVHEALAGLPNVVVDSYQGLTVNYARQHDCSVIIRGLRAVTDFEYELSLSSLNQQLAPEIETLLVFAHPQYYYISSRAVKEIATFGGPVQGLVPDNVVDPLLKKLGEKLRSKKNSP